IGAVAVEAVAAIAALRPLFGGERLAHRRRLRFLNGIEGGDVLERRVVERGGHAFHGLVAARAGLVGLHRRDDVLCVLTGEARRRRAAADAGVAVAAAAACRGLFAGG